MGRRRVNISVSSEALELLERLQGRMGLNRSALLELLVREEAARRRISLQRFRGTIPVLEDSEIAPRRPWEGVTSARGRFAMR